MLPTDEELVQQAKTAPPGDIRAFEELVRRHQAKVQTNCRYLSGNEEDALDLTQEVLVKTFFNLERFAERSSFGTWVGRIKVNHCLNHLRRERGKAFVDLDEPELAGESALQDHKTAAAHLAGLDRRSRIDRVLDEMGETLRIPLIMRDMDGFSYQEIADELGLSLSAVKMRIKRARAEFRLAYGAREPHDGSQPIA